MANAVQSKDKSNILINKLAEKYNVTADRMFTVLQDIAFAVANRELSKNELCALCMVCLTYGLNPIMKHVHAVYDRNVDVVSPVISVFGWLQLMHNHPDFDGYSVDFSEKLITLEGERNRQKVKVTVPEYCEVSIFRKGLSHPLVNREYAVECFMPMSPAWCKTPRRMLRHRTMVVAIRYSFGFSEGESDMHAVMADAGAMVQDAAPFAVPSALPESPRPSEPAVAPSPAPANATIMRKSDLDESAIRLKVEKVIQREQSSGINGLEFLSKFLSGESFDLAENIYHELKGTNNAQPAVSNSLPEEEIPVNEPVQVQEKAQNAPAAKPVNPAPAPDPYYGYDDQYLPAGDDMYIPSE